MNYIVISLLFCTLNILGTRSFLLSLIVTIIEYLIVYFFLLYKRDYYKSFIYFTIFTTVTCEMDIFIYGDDAPFTRYTFFNFPLVFDWMYNVTLIFLLFRCYKKYGISLIKNNRDIFKFFKWCVYLLVFGSLSVFVGVILNDNGMVSSGLFPRVAVSTILRYIFLCAFLYLCAVYSILRYDEVSELTKNLLLVLAISGVISVAMGMFAYYGEADYLILAPMCFGFTPCMLMFYKKGNQKTPAYPLLAMLIIILAFVFPCIIGSKWYLIIAATLFYLIYDLSPIKSLWSMTLVLVALVLFVPFIMDAMEGMMGGDNFNNWKFYQAMGAINFLGHDSLLSWFYSLDDSAQFRIDEILNISIEYMNKPFYILFGKGLGGTTLHYTYFPNLNWEGDASFTEEQIKYGIFYQMHESSGIIYLRHGLMGVAFMFVVIKDMLVRMRYTPWSVVGLLWFFFFWGFGVSYRLGALALVLAYVYTDKVLRVNGTN